MLEKFKDLKKMSQYVGNRSDYVQGGGGNTSVKINSTHMAIKASGTLLSELTQNKGFAVVDYPAVKQLLEEKLSNEDFSKKTGDLLVFDYHSEQSVRPSIETGFHALLDDFVVHSHSVYANILTSSEEGEEISKQLFPNSCWVPYVKPGLELTRFIYQLTTSSPAQVIFLQNHGVIVSGSCADGVINLHQQVSESIIQSLNLPSWGDVVDTVDHAFMRKHVLFPDQVIFTQTTSEKLLNSVAGKETTSAYQYIYKNIMDLGFSHRFLSESDMTDLLHMESEKYRQSIAK